MRPMLCSSRRVALDYSNMLNNKSDTIFDMLYIYIYMCVHLCIYTACMWFL